MHGEFEGACKFDKRNNKTGCKKFISIQGSWEDARELAFRQLFCAHRHSATCSVTTSVLFCSSLPQWKCCLPDALTIHQAMLPLLMG